MMILENKLCGSAARLGRGFQIRPSFAASWSGSSVISVWSVYSPNRPRNWLFSSFLKHFFIIIMFIKYVYDHNNDVWIIKVGGDSYYLNGLGPKMVK